MLDKIDNILSGDIKVYSTINRGFTPEEIAERATDKIIFVGKDSHEIIRAQAEAYKEHIKSVILYYLKEAVKSDHTTIANRLREAGHPELINLLEN